MVEEIDEEPVVIGRSRLVGVFTSEAAAKAACDQEKADHSLWSGGKADKKWVVNPVQLNAHSRHWDVHKSLGDDRGPF